MRASCQIRYFDFEFRFILPSLLHTDYYHSSPNPSHHRSHCCFPTIATVKSMTMELGLELAWRFLNKLMIDEAHRAICPIGPKDGRQISLSSNSTISHTCILGIWASMDLLVVHTKRYHVNHSVCLKDQAGTSFPPSSNRPDSELRSHLTRPLPSHPAHDHPRAYAIHYSCKQVPTNNIACLARRYNVQTTLQSWAKPNPLQDTRKSKP